jgi:branched-chain amino acid transport system substrate-binding protein
MKRIRFYLVLMSLVLSFVIVQLVTAAEPVKIGLISSRSGVFADWGTQEIRGFQLGIDSATNGTNKVLGRDIQLIIEDDAGTPAIGVQTAIKLLSENKVDVIAGAVSSGVA